VDNAADAALLIALYTARFVPEADTAEAWTTFREARQREDEPYLAWHVRLRDIFCRAYPDLAAAAVEDHRDLRSAFTMGIADDEVKREAWRRPAANYQAALINSTNAESALAQMPTLGTVRTAKQRPGAYAVAPMGHEKGPERGTPGGKRGGPNAVEKRRCFYCDKEGHIVRDCRLKQNHNAGGSHSRG
jgi:hypothetical protein